MTRQKKRVFIMLMAAVLSMAASVHALAAEGVISSVTIRVDSDIEPGDTLPDITIANQGESSSAPEGGVCVSVSSEKYYISEADWVTSTTKDVKVGDRPEMKVTLTPGGSSDDDYYFKGSYKSSNVSVKHGDFISAKRDDDDLVVRLRVEYVEGDFAEPEDAYWKDNSKGTARWEKPDSGGTGKYEVELRRGSSKVHSVQTTSTSYNFYPYMTVAGTYTFRVRTIGKSSKEEDYGKKSVWVKSDEIYIAKEDVSDGSGRADGVSGGGASIVGNTQVGWRQIDGYWYYYYPDGNYQRNSWLNVNNRWYLFQEEGKMLRGWQRKNNNTYYLNENGEMVTGWIHNGQNWYYLNDTKDAYEGAMLNSHWLNKDGRIYYFAANGAMVEGWWQIDGNWYYFYPGAGNLAVNTVIDTFYVDQNGIWRR